MSPAAARAAAILAGGSGLRLCGNKPLVELAGRPLVAYVEDAARRVAGEVIVVTKEPLAARLKMALSAETKVVIDEVPEQTPLAGIAAGLKRVTTTYVALLGCDTPLLLPRVLDALFTHAGGRDAAIPEGPSGQLEPLIAVYRRSAAERAASDSMRAGERAVLDMVRRLRDLARVPLDLLREVDPDLVSFRNVNTHEDLAKAEAILMRRSGASNRVR